MTIRYFPSSVLVSAAGADAVTANDDDTIIVETGVTLGATGALATTNLVYGVFGATGVGGVDVQVYGTVFGTNGGIRLNDPAALQSVFVGATGRVLSEGVAVTLTGSRLDVENAGLIRAESTAISLGGNSDVLNTGTITSLTSDGIFVVSGNVDLVNTGTIRGSLSAFYNIGSGDTTIWNSGVMVGDVYLGSGNDLYQGGGTVLGTVLGGEGDDTLIGGDRDDLLVDFFGSNWVAGGNGADDVGVAVLAAGQQTSHVFGGIIGGADTSADDTIVVGTDVPGANIFLSTGAALGSVTRIGDNAVAAFITGFENATGTNRADAIFGSSAANVIEGGDSGDWMVGNGGADRFVFNFAGHADAGDQIRDFRRSEGDRIDLAGIDANSTIAGNESFVFRTTHTNNAAGEVVVTNFATSAVVNLYIDADNVVDGTFVVVFGEAGVTSLTAADFLL